MLAEDKCKPQEMVRCGQESIMVKDEMFPKGYILDT